MHVDILKFLEKDLAINMELNTAMFLQELMAFKPYLN